MTFPLIYRIGFNSANYCPVYDLVFMPDAQGALMQLNTNPASTGGARHQPALHRIAQRLFIQRRQGCGFARFAPLTELMWRYEATVGLGSQSLFLPNLVTVKIFHPMFPWHFCNARYIVKYALHLYIVDQITIVNRTPFAAPC